MENLPQMDNDTHYDVLSTAKPLAALIKNRGMALSGLVLTHWVGINMLPAGRSSMWFSGDQQPVAALTLLLAAPRISPFFEAVSEELDAVGGAAWIIDAIFDEERGNALHANALLESSIAYRGVEDADITLDQSLTFLKTWRRNVRRQMLGSCIDWIEL